jgi:hypothetical protein
MLVHGWEFQHLQTECREKEGDHLQETCCTVAGGTVQALRHPAGQYWRRLLH